MFPSILADTVTLRDEYGRVQDRRPLMRPSFTNLDTTDYPDPFDIYDNEGPLPR